MYMMILSDDFDDSKTHVLLSQKKYIRAFEWEELENLSYDVKYYNL